jgi:hypothetical protein
VSKAWPLCFKLIDVLTSVYLNLYRTPETAVELPAAARALAPMLVVLMSVPLGGDTVCRELILQMKLHILRLICCWISLHNAIVKKIDLPLSKQAASATATSASEPSSSSVDTDNPFNVNTSPSLSLQVVFDGMFGKTGLNTKVSSILDKTHVQHLVGDATDVAALAEHSRVLANLDQYAVGGGDGEGGDGMSSQSAASSSSPHFTISPSDTLAPLPSHHRHTSTLTLALLPAPVLACIITAAARDVSALVGRPAALEGWVRAAEARDAGVGRDREGSGDGVSRPDVGGSETQFHHKRSSSSSSSSTASASASASASATDVDADAPLVSPSKRQRLDTHVPSRAAAGSHPPSASASTSTSASTTGGACSAPDMTVALSLVSLSEEWVEEERACGYANSNDGRRNPDGRSGNSTARLGDLHFESHLGPDTPASFPPPSRASYAAATALPGASVPVDALFASTATACAHQLVLPPMEALVRSVGVKEEADGREARGDAVIT